MANFFSNLFKAGAGTTSVGSSANVQLINGRKDLVKAALINQFTNAKNPDVDLKKAEVVSTIYTCIKVLSENVVKLPLGIYKDDGRKKTLLKTHKYYQALRYNPQQWVNNKDWLTAVIACLYLRGNAYAYVSGSEFKILDPDTIDIGMYKNQLWYMSSQLDVPFTPDEILHFRLIGKDPLAKGLNPIESLKVELNIQVKAEQTVNAFYSNNAHSTKYLEQQADLGKTNNTKLAEIIENWQQQYAGFDNSGNVIVVPPNFTLKELKLSADDMAFLESAKYSEASIASLFGVPLYLLGKNDPTGKYEESALYFRNNTLSALLNVITTELEFKLLTPEERMNGVTIEFDVNAMLNTNLIDKSTVYKSIAQQGALTPNEFRKAFNIEISDNPALDNYYIQSQYVMLDRVADGTAKGAPSNNMMNNDKSNEN